MVRVCLWHHVHLYSHCLECMDTRTILPFICSFIHSFLYAFVKDTRTIVPFIHSFMHFYAFIKWIPELYPHTFFHPSIHLIVHLFIYWFIHSFFYLPIHVCTLACIIFYIICAVGIYFKCIHKNNFHHNTHIPVPPWIIIILQSSWMQAGKGSNLQVTSTNCSKFLSSLPLWSQC